MEQPASAETLHTTKARRRPHAKRRLARRVIERAPPVLGWRSSDEEEVERRRWRGRAEVAGVEPLDAAEGHFGTFRVRSASGGSYDVEIRSLNEPLNSCGCADHRVNGLGTCKHVEAVLARLRRSGVRAFAAATRAGSPRVELFLARNGETVPRIMWPADSEMCATVRAALSPFLTSDGDLANATPATLEVAIQAIDAADLTLRRHLRVSRYLAPWIGEARRRAARNENREAFLAEVEAGRQTFDVLRHKLLPYQRDGMLHLAFGERALLADDMGLGKTIQAIAACELLRRLRGIGRVLVVCPASLKGEWQEQIARFSEAPTRLINGARPARLHQYTAPAFFTVVNYEQVVIDADEINRLVRPDVVILDEAQRIKNWHTKTARVVKSLAAPYAFVLTGTPIENRIDEIYSIVQFLDPGLLGPLFRFNRDFYELDERGRPIGYQNLDVLMRKLQPILLRRRKSDVETELPGRTVTNYLVGMAEEQRLRYEEYRGQAARIAAIAKRRPLTQKEFERLQLLLACMRMLCDTPYILDRECRLSPKLEELERILAELLADPDRKVIVFSEWERMLTLVRELATEMGLEFAWHTGSVPQQRRRAEVARFKQDPDCRLFLSTDSGSVGLNLQAASAVINLDLPWNPAKLEQRIARAWRKNQFRTVDVINLVTEDSIEHTMLHLLAQKQALADGVLDGTGDLTKLKMPSGRQAFVDRVAMLMESPVEAAAEAVTPPPDLSLRDDLVARHGDALLLLQARKAADGREVLLVVLDGDAAAVAAERERLAGEAQREVQREVPRDAPRIEVLDRSTHQTIERLTEAGLLHATSEMQSEMVRSSLLADPAEAIRRQRLAQCTEWLGGAERKLRMAMLLAQGGFAEEAMPTLSECLELARNAQAMMRGEAIAWDLPEPGEPRVAEVVAEPVQHSIEQMLAEVRRSLAEAQAAA